MDRGLGQYIGLIIVSAGAVVLGMSYMAAYLIGKANGRREEQGSSRAMEQMDSAQRLAAIESSVYGLSSTLERLRDAQRLLAAQQDHLSRKVGVTDRGVGLPAVKGTNTPS